jgi:ribonuclease P protein component
MASTPNSILRLRKHADYQRVYASSKKQFAKQMSYFYALRPAERRSDTTGPRIGLTVGKVMGKAVERNRIKRRMRECIRRSAGLIHAPVDVILHPRRVVIELEFAKLEREVAQVFRSIQMALDKQAALGEQASGIQAANKQATDKQTSQQAAEDVAGQ